jgi:hypothetical protein
MSDGFAVFQTSPDWIERECLSPATFPDLVTVVGAAGEIDALLTGGAAGGSVNDRARILAVVFSVKGC